MIEEEIREAEVPSQPPRSANDNKGAAEAGIDPRIVTIARAIGRQIAREQLDALRAANENERADER